MNLREVSNPKIDVKLINNSPYISIYTSIEGSINSSGEQFDYTNTDNIIKLENSANEYFENLLKEYLYKISKEYDSDIAGFSGYLKAKFLTTDLFNKINWNDIFKDSYFDVKVKTKITSSQLFNRE